MAAVAVAVTLIVATAGLIVLLRPDQHGTPTGPTSATPSKTAPVSTPATSTAPPTATSARPSTDTPLAVGVPALPRGTILFTTVVGGTPDYGGPLWGVEALLPRSARPAEVARTPVHPGVVSPDGLRLAWVQPTSAANGSGRLMVSDVVTGESPVPDHSAVRTRPGRELTAGVPYLPYAWLAWSPDSHRIAYVDVHGRLNAIGADGSGPIVLADAPTGTGAHWWNVAWSPDGRRIAAGAGTTLRLIAAQGTPRVTELPLSETGRTPGGLSWSPDGTTLASVPVAGGNEQRLRLIDVATGAVRVLPSGNLVQGGTAWLDDSTVLAVRYHPVGQDGYLEIVTIDRASGTAHLRAAISPDRPVTNPEANHLHVITG